MRIDFTNAVVEDDGYGVEVNGRSLEAIISTALGTRLGDKGGYSSGLPRFKANSCDVTVIITPHPTECTINTTLIVKGKKTINDVPPVIREQVKQILIDLDLPELAE